MDKNIKHVADVLGIPEYQVKKQAKKTMKMPEGMKKAPATVPKPFSGTKQLLHNRFMGIVNKAAVPKPSGTALPYTPGKDIPEEDKVVLSVYTKPDKSLKRDVLAKRQPGQPSILQECRTPIKLSIHQPQSPGDILMLTAAIRDLHTTYPGMFVTSMSTSCMELWEHNPYNTKLDKNDPDLMFVRAEYTDSIARSNAGSYHFIHGFRLDLEAKLGIPIVQGDLKGDIHLSHQETAWLSQVWEIEKKNIPYWIIDSGTKSDFTNKQWEWARYQEVVDAFPNVTFVQVGANEATHRHPPLTGDNVINLVGKTTMRQFVRLMYHAAGVITPVSFPMHLSAAVPMHPRYKRRYRPCIVIAGGREPAVWEAYTNHQFLHNCGALPCSAQGGCWKSRIEPIGDGDKKDFDGLCERPYVSKSGQIVPMCMEMITTQMVKGALQMYLTAYDYTNEDDTKWSIPEYRLPVEAVKGRLAVLVKSPAKASSAIGKDQAAKRKQMYTDMLGIPAKKTPVKKTPVKKAPVKKAPVKKTPVKKAPVKKAPVKKKRKET